MQNKRKEGKALVVCNHPGGARVVLPVIESLMEKKPEIFFDLILTDNAYPIFSLPPEYARKELINEDLSADAYDNLDLRSYAFVLAGTSISGNLEKSFVSKSREQNVPVFSVLDHWCEYNIRFQDEEGQLNAIPDVIFVPDEIARHDLLEMGVPGQQIIISGHPAFDVARKAAEGFSKERREAVLGRLPRGFQDYILFVSEPVEDDHSDKNLGYSEFSTLDGLCHSLSQLEGEARISLVIKLHPREHKSKYDTVVRKYKGLNIISVKDEIDRFDLILSAKLVLGISSMLLLEAAVLGLPVYCIAPGTEGASFIGVKLGWVSHLESEASLATLLNRGTVDRPRPQIGGQMRAAHFIVDFILNAVHL